MDTAAVWVENACKSYKQKMPVLQDLCMHVEKQSIYGLLGASGCGKTTLLSCIVGRKRLNSGSIWVLGGQPGMEGSGVPGPKVGYMPQDIALVAEFTVRDAVFYFGRIFEMKEKHIEERFEKLSKLLDLPPEDRFLKNCSGGQQRRVSFAAAMVHMPQLLILDEPTVGIDPVLRERIWNYLVEITRNEQISVIITTHYIEEARQAHRIGLMRDGKLLAEDSPSRLLQTFSTNTLENVFLILSRRQEDGRLNAINHNTIMENQNLSNNVSSFDIAEHGSKDMLTPPKTHAKAQPMNNFSLNGRHLHALMDKNWKQFYRNPSGITFILMFPILEILAFLLAVGPDIKQIPLGIVNDESMQITCPNFTANGTAIPYSFSSCHFRNFSCRFLDYLDDPMIHKVQFDSIETGLQATKHGEVVGVLYMASNFTSALEERVEDLRGATDDVLDFSEIKVWLDLSNRQIGSTIKYKLLSLYMEFQKSVFKDCQYFDTLSEPIHLETIYGEKDDTFTIFMTPGVVVTLIFFMGTVMTSQIIITDRCEGVWDRSAVAGVTSLEITLTHFLLQASLLVVQIVEVFAITFLLFGIQYIGNVWVLAFISFMEGLAGMSYGFWISVISVNHSMANIITTGSFYPMILICGLVWPLEGMPLLLQIFSKCLPFTIAINSFRNVMMKGWSIDHLEVLNGIGIGMIWIVFLIVLSIYMIKAKR